MRTRRLGSMAVITFLITLSSSSLTLAARVDSTEDGPTAYDAESRRIALGVSIWKGRDLSQLDRFRSSIGGRTPAIWTIWSQWGATSTRAFPSTAANGARARGATPLVWWEPIDPERLSSPTYARHANIIAGRHDDYIRNFARDAKAFQTPVLLRFAHEANSSYFPWGVARFDNTSASYVAAWRHIHRIFAEVGASNVKFVWSVAKKTCPGGCNPYTRFYPGDAYVDYMGFSSFNWGAQKGGWTSMLKGFRRVTKLLSRISAKPIIAVESASSAQGGDKAAWIRKGYADVHAALPAIVAIVYLNVDLRSSGHPDWRLNSPAAALNAYAAVAAKPKFQGRLPH